MYSSTHIVKLKFILYIFISISKLFVISIDGWGLIGVKYKLLTI